MISIIYIALLLITFSAIFSRGVRSTLASPVLLFIFCLSVVHFFVPLYQELSGAYRFYSEYRFSSKLYAATYSLAYLLIFILSSVLIFNKARFQWPAYKDLKKIRFENFLMNIWLLMIVLSTAYLLIQIFSVGLYSYLPNRIEFLRGYGPILLIIQSSPLISIYFYLRLKEKVKPKTLLVISILIVLFQLWVFSLIGSRNTFFILVMLSALVYAFLNKKISMKLKFFSFMFLFLISIYMSIYGYLRVRDESGIQQISSGESSFSRILEDGLINAYGNHELLVWLMDNDNYWNHTYGSTFLAAVTNFVPRPLWPEKPLGGGPEIRNIIKPDSYYVGGQNLTSYTTGIIVESYMNFGWGGLSVAFAHSLILYLMLSIFGSQNSQSQLIFRAWTILVLCVLVFYSEILGLTSRYIVVSTPFFIACWIERNRSRKNYGKR